MNSLKAIKNCAAFRNRLRLSGHVREHSTQQVKTVSIPLAKPRGATDILKALSDTVLHDSTSPGYNFIDDNVFAPRGFRTRTLFGISKESGKRAARYFFDQYPQYFLHDISEPKIDAFTYREVFDITMDFTLEDLEHSIDKMEVENSIVCYKKLLQDKIDIPPNMVDDLLDLACFFNSANYNFDEVSGFAFSYSENFYPKECNNLWQENSFAEELFYSIVNKSDRNYISIIRGMVRHGNANGAYAMYQKALYNHVILDVKTFNDVISIVYFCYTNNDDRWKEIVSIFKEMDSKNVNPDVETLTVALQALVRFKFYPQAFQNAKLIYNEIAFNNGIFPTKLANALMLHLYDKCNDDPSQDPNDQKRRAPQRTEKSRVKSETKDGENPQINEDVKVEADQV